jgi:hypothetical protein
MVPLIGTASTDADKPGYIVEPDRIEMKVTSRSLVTFRDRNRQPRVVGQAV